MCLYGIYKWVNIIHPINKKVAVDACIADEIQMLNSKGVRTIGSCCGHGKAGQVVEYTNGFGFWKTYEYPPHVLIEKESDMLARKLGYSPYPYYYADGTHHNVLMMPLKSGCLTESDCVKWHHLNNIELNTNLGIIN